MAFEKSLSPLQENDIKKHLKNMSPKLIISVIYYCGRGGHNQSYMFNKLNMLKAKGVYSAEQFKNIVNNKEKDWVEEADWEQVSWVIDEVGEMFADIGTKDKEIFEEFERLKEEAVDKYKQKQSNKKQINDDSNTKSGPKENHPDKLEDVEQRFELPLDNERADELWETTLMIVQSKISKEGFNICFKDLQVNIEDNKVLIKTSNDLVRDSINNRYKELLLRVLYSLTDTKFKVYTEINEDLQSKKEEETDQKD